MLTAFAECTPVAFAKNVCPPGVPRWGAGWKDWMARNAQSVGAVYAQLDALPYEHNRLDLDPRVTDPLGVPVIRVTYDYTDNENRMHTFLREKQRLWLLEAGASETWSTQPTPNPRGVHSYGGTRMGNNPDTNVADKWGMAHEVPNLGFFGGSLMGAASGHNPTLTVQALAWRTAVHIARNYERIAS
jgi:gluconate 2-dehydrogenase alpha chain